MLIAVPDLSPCRLRNRKTPPCCSTRAFVAHKPIPVPTSAFVVKKGTKILFCTSRDMPLPLSASVIRTPSSAPLLQPATGALEARFCSAFAMHRLRLQQI